MEEIKNAYKKQLFLWHPDRIKINSIVDKNEANSQTAKIINAYKSIKENINLGVIFDIKSTTHINIYGDLIFKSKVQDFVDTDNINWNIRKKIISSNIEWIEYHTDIKTLVIKFKKSGVYSYKNIPQDIITEFEESLSKGKYFNQNICFFFVCNRIDNYSEWCKEFIR